MTEDMVKKLVSAALGARQNAYVPYSGYRVGAAVLTAEGAIYTGCNIENASYGLSSCAERTAIFKAVSDGHRELLAIAIAGGREEELPLSDYAFPCGACRQVLSEFAAPEAEVIVARDASDYRLYKLGGLLPESFGKEKL